VPRIESIIASTQCFGECVIRNVDQSLDNAVRAVRKLDQLLSYIINYKELFL